MDTLHLLKLWTEGPSTSLIQCILFTYRVTDRESFTSSLRDSPIHHLVTHLLTHSLLYLLLIYIMFHGGLVRRKPLESPSTTNYSSQRDPPRPLYREVHFPCRGRLRLHPYTSRQIPCPPSPTDPVLPVPVLGTFYDDFPFQPGSVYPGTYGPTVEPFPLETVSPPFSYGSRPPSTTDLPVPSSTCSQDGGSTTSVGSSSSPRDYPYLVPYPSFGSFGNDEQVVIRNDPNDLGSCRYSVS